MARTKDAGSQSLTSLLAESAELRLAAVRLATLALARMEQDGKLRVRQIEQLRRALSTAGETRAWMGVAHSQKDAAAKASKDLLAMVKTGAQDLADDLANQVKLKKTEAARLADLVESTRAQAENEDTEYPLEIVYVYTIRDASQGLVTKTAAYTPSDTKEANSAADSLEKSIPGRTKLADLMVIELKKRQAQVAAMTKTLPDFVDSSQTILLEVLANLQ